MSYKIPQKDVIVEIEMDEYPSRIMISSKRRTYYKKWSKNMPKKYKDYSKDKKGFLIDKYGHKLIKNTRTAGTPRYYNLRGQDLWSFNIHPIIKGNVATALKKIYYEQIRGIDPDAFIGKVLGVELQFYGPIEVNGRMEEDLDNMIRWHQKCFLDSACGNVEFYKAEDSGELLPDRVKYPAILIDDNLKVIRELPVKFIEVNDRKLIIRIYEV